MGCTFCVRLWYDARRNGRWEFLVSNGIKGVVSSHRVRTHSRTFQDHYHFYVKIQGPLSIEFRSHKQKHFNNIRPLCSRGWSFDHLQKVQLTSSRLCHCGISTWCRREKNHWLWYMFLFSQGISHNLHAFCLSCGSLKNTSLIHWDKCSFYRPHKRPEKNSGHLFITTICTHLFPATFH